MIGASRLVRWWCGAGGDELELQFAASFQFDMTILTWDRAEFLASREWSGGFSDLVIIEAASSQECSTIVFEATDNVTMLRYRFSWVVRFEREQVVRITARHSPVRRP